VLVLFQGYTKLSWDMVAKVVELGDIVLELVEVLACRIVRMAAEALTDGRRRSVTVVYYKRPMELYFRYSNSRRQDR
jgi:hypothetical protein